MRFALFVSFVVGLGILGTVSSVSAISYCGKLTGVETGGIDGNVVNITLNATSGGVPVANGATVTDGTLVVSGTITDWKGQSVFCSDVDRVCYWDGDDSCTTYDRAEIDNILVNTTWTMGCGTIYCSAKTGTNPQYRSYSANIPLNVGSNTITVSGLNNYYTGLQQDCQGLGSSCRIGTGFANSLKSITVIYVVATPVPTTDAADWIPTANWYPPLVAPGQTFSFAVPMKNCRVGDDCTSLTTWTGGTNYMLQTSAANATRWSIAQNALVSGSVLPSGQQSFIYSTARAPATPGDYPLESFQMLHGSLFGEATPPVIIRVNARPQGAVETTTCNTVSGYALDPNNPSAIVSVRVFENGSVVDGPFAANGPHAAPYDGHGWRWTPPVNDTPHAYVIQVLDPDDNTWYPIGNASVACYTPPTSSITSITPPDYCSAAASPIVNWQYTSPAGRPQGTWRLRVAADFGFTSIQYDSGVQPGAITSAPVPGLPGGIHWAEVVVTDDQGTIQSNLPNRLTFTTSSGLYPQPQITFEPGNPATGQEIQFSGNDALLNNGDPSDNPTGWLWGFGDGGTSNDQNPAYTYAASGSYTVTLQVSNVNGMCQTTRTIGLQEAIPQYREVRP